MYIQRLAENKVKKSLFFFEIFSFEVNAYMYVQKTLFLRSCRLNLKEPKLEIFSSRVFPKIIPVCVGDLGTRQKNSKF
jgi:hypothetical protein